MDDLFDEEVPEDGGGRFRGLEPQTAESNENAINIMGYTHSSDLRAEIVAAFLAGVDAAIDASDYDRADALLAVATEGAARV